MARIFVVALFSFVFALGCESMVEPEVPVSLQPSFAAMAATDSAAVEGIAYAFARAMEDAGVRASVRSAWRASLVSQHKLILQEYVATPNGAALVEVASQRSGLGTEQIWELIERLPQMDFYVPRREDRQSWKATDDIQIYATIEEDDDLIRGFTTSGSSMLLRSGEDPGQPLVLLHPAEPKALRWNPQPDVSGDVIEEIGDGRIAGTVEWTDPSGKAVSTPLGSHLAGVQGASGSLSPNTAGPSFNQISGSATYLAAIRVHDMDGAGWQNCELRYGTTFYRDGVFVASRTVTDTEVPCPDTKNYEAQTPPGFYLLGYEPRDEPAPDQIRLAITELDTWDDDNWGSAQWGYVSISEYTEAGVIIVSYKSSGSVNGWKPFECTDYNYFGMSYTCYSKWEAILKW